MNKSLSLYLNGVRFFAATLVFIFHMGYFAHWYVPIVGRYGDEAVVAFFVLSGFVISHSARFKHADLGDYALARFARLWSIVVPAILLTFVFDTVGQRVNLPAYAPMVPYSPVKWLVSGMANATFLNQFWSFSIWPGTNGPFWSIAYEFWYYMIFGAWFYLAGTRRFFLVAIALLVAGPKIVAALPVWLIGVVLFRALPGRDRRGAPLLGAVLWSSALGLLIAFFALDLSAPLREAFPAFATFARDNWEVDFLPKSYVLGLLLGLNFGGFMLLSQSMSAVPRRLSSAVGVMADASFGIYLFHYPIGYFVKALLWSRGVTEGTGYVATIYLVSFALSFGLGLLFDRSRKPLRRQLDRLASHVSPLLWSAARAQK